MSINVKYHGYKTIITTIIYAATLIVLVTNLELLVNIYPSLPLICIVLTFCLILEGWRPTKTAIAAITFCFIIYIANWVKLKLTTIPLTSTDIFVFGAHPFSSLNALMLPYGLHLILALAAFIILAYVSLYFIYLLLSRPIRIILVAALVSVIFIKYPFYVKLLSEQIVQDDTWVPKGLARISRKIGLPAFLVYSHWLEDNDAGIINDGKPTNSITPPHDPSNIIRADNIIPHKPNIIVVLVESTFNPNIVFNIDRKFESFLFEESELTHELGPLYVNAIGGGTWISEFEFLTGLDTRLFGYKGYYTHATLSHLINISFVRYLTQKGYRAEAYYGTEASFFNARRAFLNYGFEQFFEKDHLGIEAKGWEASDVEIADAVISSSKKQLTFPFFKFINTLENHSPHHCGNFQSEQALEYRLSGNAPFEYNCTLNEYLRRLRSTEKAILKLVDYMKEMEKESGRPFVILLFGDHQPHSFTRTGGSLMDFRPYKKVDDPRVTFFHIISSAKRSIELDRDAMPPLTLLPTLMSAYVVGNFRDLYLPINAWAFEQCGRDIIGSAPSKGFREQGDIEQYFGSQQLARSTTCGVIDRIISSYRQSDVLRAQP